MHEILEGPFSQIVREGDTEMIIVTPIPVWEEEINEMAQGYVDLLRPTKLGYEYGLVTKDSPDGETSHHVLIWHVKWDHEKTKRLPLLEPISLQ